MGESHHIWVKMVGGPWQESDMKNEQREGLRQRNREGQRARAKQQEGTCGFSLSAPQSFIIIIGLANASHPQNVNFAHNEGLNVAFNMASIRMPFKRYTQFISGFLEGGRARMQIEGQLLMLSPLMLLCLSL